MVGSELYVYNWFNGKMELADLNYKIPKRNKMSIISYSLPSSDV